MRLFLENQQDIANFSHKLTYVKSVGLFTMITGILGQLIGLLDAFKAIEQMGDISPAMLAGGLKVSTDHYPLWHPVYLISILILVLAGPYAP